VLPACNQQATCADPPSTLQTKEMQLRCVAIRQATDARSACTTLTDALCMRSCRQGMHAELCLSQSMARAAHKPLAKHTGT
jgi:hypothetical protein